MTTRNISKMLLVIAALAFLGWFGIHSARVQRAAAASANIEKVLSWLPADTETVTVARGDFVFPENPNWQRSGETPISGGELAQSFENLPLWLFQLEHGSLSGHLKAKRVALAVEGARHFRPPAALGMMPFEGCAIAVLGTEPGAGMETISDQAAKESLKAESISGEKVFVFQQKLENDTWTTYVAFPGKDVILVATDRNYIEEVLLRIHGKTGGRALPSYLPEWKYVNIEARFWGLRHYDPVQSKLDPSSPLGGTKSANFPDEQAVGLTFVFDPSKGRTAKITYLSGDTGLQKNPTSTLLAMGQAPEGRDLNGTIRELAPGAWEGSYTLRQFGPAGFFIFFLSGILGHAVYL